MAVPLAPVRVSSQMPLAPSVTSVTSVTSVSNDKGDNEIIPGAVHRSLAFDLQLRKRLENLTYVTFDATSYRLKWGPLPPNEIGRIAQHVRRKKERTKKGIGNEA